MDRLQLVLVALPLFLFCSDIFNLFAPPPPKPSSAPRPRSPLPNLHSNGLSHAIVTEAIPKIGELGYGVTVDLRFCASCSYRGTALTMKKMLETSFPGIEVVLENYPPPLPKRLLSKLVPVVQFGVIGIVLAGDQIFPRLGFMAPPPWYFNLRANRFGSIATTWLLGNFLQSFLQSSGAFEVYCNGNLVFSKLKEHRFPSELELQDLIRRSLSTPHIANHS
ncbi:Selenoprotein T protein [Dioscorea alata]|uniref:Selenoprotein T protein n=1 Tax=Dioscorea alata TaxID=55571 RepID=A0ACB7V349_DIOAL|nr:Selenoprotein T protein [Dioscorea alata]